MLGRGVSSRGCRPPTFEPLEDRRMLAFVIGTEFTGGSFEDSGFIPPDTMGAVGPNHIAELINGRAAVYDRNGVQQIAGTLDQFWTTTGVTPEGSSFDPRILYDAASGRFFAAAVDNAGNANNFLIAVSNTSDPTAGWTGFQIDSDTDDSHTADYPMLGLNDDVLTVSANMFPLTGQSVAAAFLVIPKSDLLAAVPSIANATLIEDIDVSETGFTPQPIVDLENGDLPLPILSEFNKSAGSLKTSHIGGTASVPTLDTTGGVIAVTARGLPPDIDQPGTKVDIDVGDSRFGGNVILRQIPGRTNPSLWGVHSVDIGGRAAIEWYEIDAVTNGLTQSGTISDPSLAFNFPSIAVNDLGDVVIGFSGGDPATFMSTYVSVGQTTAGVTTFDPVMQTHAGVADYEILDDIGRNRWGDYSATVVDPTDQRRMWTFQEFASGTDEWSVRVTEIIIISTTVSIGDDVAVIEGDSGTVDAVFVVGLTDPGTQAVTVSYTAVDATAVAGDDFQAQSGVLTFEADGPLTQTITIKVIGDTIVEGNETFQVRLSDASGAILERSTAVGTILNDDIDLAIGDITIVEGHAGTRDAVFTVSAAGVVDRTVTVNYTTLDGSATAADDYLPRAGVLAFPPGTTAAQVTVPVLGDRLNEGDHSFSVFLHSAIGARIADELGTAVIIDDDRLSAFYVSDAQLTTISDRSYAIFTVALDAASGREASVEYATADGDATAIGPEPDYLARSGELTFAPGITSIPVSVEISGTAESSANRRFFLNLSNPQDASMGDGRGVATIVFPEDQVREEIIDDGDAGYRQTNGWTNATNTLAYGLDYDYHAGGGAGAAATWTFTGLASGSYQVFTRWAPFGNRATNAPYTVLDGLTPLGTVQVNQQLAPAGEESDGLTWQSLGTFEINSDTLAVRLTDNANGFVVADAVRIVSDAIDPPAPVIEGVDEPEAAPAHNAALPQDVNADGRVSPNDALIVINNLAAQSVAPVAAPAAATRSAGAAPTYYVDVSADGRLSSVDLLMVVNYLLQTSSAAASAAPQTAPSSEGAPLLAAVAVDQAIGQLDDASPSSAADAPPTDELIGADDADAGNESTAASPSPLTPSGVQASFASDDEESGESEDAEFDPVLLAFDP